MLKQLVYRSHSTGHIDEAGLQKITFDSSRFNERHNITGILLFDGEYFFQVLEGEGEPVDFLFEHIKNDSRHENVVKVTEVVVHKRDFGDWHLRALTVVEGSSCYWLPPDIILNRESRIFALLNSFASGKWRTCLSNEDRKNLKVNVSTLDRDVAPYRDSPIQFAFQPIVDTSKGRISSIEALIRSEDGKYPEDIIGCLEGAEKYEFDLETKAIAIKQGAALINSEQSLSINLCPGAITHRANVGEYLHSLVTQSGLHPQQLVVEVTEVEIIKESSVFHDAIEQIRSFGIGIAIDDFGAGYAGLSLLADFSPDKIKLDRKITTGIHENGPRQAITEAVLEFANSMGIPLVVEGVETLDEWLWLQHAGVQRFQGYLFAKPKLNGVKGISFNV